MTKPKNKKKAAKGRDGVYARCPGGKPTNAFLYEEIDAVTDTAAERKAYRKELLKLGLTKEEADAIS